MDQNSRNRSDKFYGQQNGSNDFSTNQQITPLSPNNNVYPVMMQPMMYPPAPMGYPFYSNQVMLEPVNEYDAYPKPSTNKVHDISTVRQIEEIRKIRKKQDDYIYCCSWCERPTNDTCYFCWRIWACPTWFVVLITLIVLLVIAGLGTILGLYAGKVSPFT